MTTPEPTASPRREDAPAWSGILPEAVVLALLMAWIYIHSWTNRWVFDDAFFFIRYARNILAGDGWSWNASMGPADGVTAPLWLALVTLGVAVSPEQWADSGVLLSWMSRLVMVVATIAFWAVGRSLVPRGWGVLALLPIVALHFSSQVNFGFSGNIGMETPLAALLVIAYAGGMLRRQVEGGWLATRGGGVALGVVGVMGVLTRPEFGLLALGAPLLQAFTLGRERRAGCLVQLATTFTILAVYALWRLWYFGDLVPLPAHVKGSIWSNPYGEIFTPNFHVIIGIGPMFLRDGGMMLVVAALGLARPGAWRKLLWLWAPLLATIAYMATSFMVMGTFQRYFLPYVSGTLLLALAAWFPRRDAGWGESLSPLLPPAPRLAAVLAVYLVIVGAVFTQTPWLQARGYDISSTSSFPEELQRFSQFPEGVSVAATEVGLLAARNMHLVIHDVAGLNDVVYARGFDADDLFARQPTVFAQVHDHYTKVVRDIRAHPDWQHYEAVFPQGATRDSPMLRTIFVDTRSEHFETIRAILQAPLTQPRLY